MCDFPNATRTPSFTLDDVLSGLQRQTASIVIERLLGGKTPVTSSSWDHERVVSRDQVRDVRNVEGRLHVARQAKHPDEWDPPIAPYEPYGDDESYETADGEDDASAAETDASAAEA